MLTVDCNAQRERATAGASLGSHDDGRNAEAQCERGCRTHLDGPYSAVPLAQRIGFSSSRRYRTPRCTVRCKTMAWFVSKSAMRITPGTELEYDCRPHMNHEPSGFPRDG